MFEGLSTLLWIHLVSALVAIVTGGLVFALPKGTVRHRRIALVYVAAMIVTTAVVIFVPAKIMPFGKSGYGFFHLFIVVGFVSSALGIYGLYRWRRTRQRKWLRMHQQRFAFSYAGLLMAGASQAMTNPRFGLVAAMTPQSFWSIFAATNIAILAVAMVMVQRHLNKGDPLRRYAMRP